MRLALGAAPSSLVALVARQMVTMIAGGGTVGVVGTVVALQALRATIPASAADAGEPLVIGGAVCLLVVAALVAAIGPARRAARVDPRIALQAE